MVDRKQGQIPPSIAEKWGLTLLLLWDALNDADELAALRTLFLEFDLTVFLREKCVVTAEADIDPRVETGAALAHDDITGDNLLAAVNLDA